MIYLIIYAFLLYICIVEIKNRRESQRILYCAFVIILLFRGLRWNTGTDWAQFYDVYKYASFSNIFSYYRYGFGTETLEFGYVFLNALFNKIFPYTVFLLFYNFIILYCYLFCVRKLISKYQITVFVFLVVSAQFFPLRQDLANALVIAAIPYIIKRNLKAVFVLILIAASIHKSIIIIIPFLCLSFLRIKTKLLFAIYCTTFVLSSNVYNLIYSNLGYLLRLINQNFANSVEVYSSLINDELKIGIGSIIINLFLLYIFTAIRDRYYSNDSRYNYLLNIFVFYVTGLRACEMLGLTYFSRIFKLLFFADSFLIGFVLIALSKLSTYSALNKSIAAYKYRTLGILIIVLFINRFIAKCNLYPETLFPYYSIFNNFTYRNFDKVITFSINLLFK